MLFADRLDDIVHILNIGGIILYPTDTIWGLGCDAMNQQAIEKIYEIKGRERGKPLILLVSDLTMLKSYVREIHPRIETLLAYHKKPLTIIYQPSEHLPDFVIPDSGSIGIRVIHEPFCRQIIARLGRPLVSTSANKSFHPYPKNFGEISSEIIKEVDYVVKFRQNEKTMVPPSVVAKFDEKGDLEFLRS